MFVVEFAKVVQTSIQ